MLFKRMSEAGDVSVPEDAHHARKQGLFLAINLNALSDEVANDRFGAGYSHGSHEPTRPFAEVIGQRGSVVCDIHESRIQ